MTDELKEHLEKLGNILRYRRTLRGMNAGEIAEGLGVPKTTYQNWETGRSQPSIVMLPKLAAFHGLTLEQLLGVIPPDEGAQIVEKLSALPPASRDAVLNLIDVLSADAKRP